MDLGGETVFGEAKGNRMYSTSSRDKVIIVSKRSCGPA